MPLRRLPDVNVRVALLDEAHVFHAQALAFIQRMRLDHEFWPCQVSLRDAGRVNWPRVMGHSQITDVYLLALAVAHAGSLVTLDHGVAITTVPGAAPRHLEHP
jgi:predicted nucleic acid-binding protein